MSQSTTTHAEPADKINTKHFELLRIARLRGLKVRKLGESMFAVTSFTRSGVEWVATLDTCSCPAKDRCTHLAAAVDYYFMNEAPVGEFMAYRHADIEDRAQLRLRIRSGELTRNDRVYVAYALKVYERKRKAAKVDSSIKTFTVRDGARVRRVERCGAFTI